MRIGILTQPLGNNYGGILQNWALQKTLTMLGHYPITLDTSEKYSILRYYVTSLRLKLLKAKGKNIVFPHKPIHGRAINPKTASFVYDYLSITPPLSNKLEKVVKDYNLDCIIVGSDQVWRPKYNYNIKDMFIGFTNENVRRIAYAASFGVDEWEFSEEETRVCKRLVNRFDAISVREHSAVNLCEEHFSIEADIVLDPTLLLEKKAYEDLCAVIPKREEPFIAFYCLDVNNQKRLLAEKLAKQKEARLISFSAHDNLFLSVEEWLAMFRDAKYVITDSFHGTVFSIIFQKQFTILPNKERGNPRIDTLMKLINDDKLLNTGEPINYLDVNKSIKKWINKSHLFINNALR